MRASGRERASAITTEHFHDLGKLLFGFNVFWAYISFSQFFLIWYASIPEETVFFHLRWSNGPWKTISAGDPLPALRGALLSADLAQREALLQSEAPAARRGPAAGDPRRGDVLARDAQLRHGAAAGHGP
jgi:hypothetical protein